MPGTLETGIELNKRWLVDEAHSYNPSGVPGHEVLSSPSMIWEMETTCAELAIKHLPGEQTTVGFHVDVKHVSPAKPGAQIVTSARLIAVDGAKLTFAVEAREGERLVGTGRHRRAIVDIANLG